MPDASEKRAPCAECAGAGYVVEQVLGHPARARRCACQVTCPKCGGGGWRLVQQGPANVAQLCPCRHLDQRLATFNAVGIPAALALASFENYKAWSPAQSKALAAARGFAQKFRSDRPTRGFLLHGEPGCGKTHLLAAALRYLALEKGASGRYIEFMLLLSDIREGFDQHKSHMTTLGPLVQVPVLAIDELGKDRGTEWERSMLDELISRRYNAGLTTLFATNYPIEPRAVDSHPGKLVNTKSREWQREAEQLSLRERVGDRVFSRLHEMCEFVRVEGPDKRKDGTPEGGAFWR